MCGGVRHMCGGLISGQTTQRKERRRGQGVPVEFGICESRRRAARNDAPLEAASRRMASHRRHWPIDDALQTDVAARDLNRQLLVRARPPARLEGWQDVLSVEGQVLGRGGSRERGERRQPVDGVEEAVVDGAGRRAGGAVDERRRPTGTGNTKVRTPIGGGGNMVFTAQSESA